MEMLQVRTRYGWWKTLLSFAIAGGFIGVIANAVFPHSHSGASIAFAVLLVVLMAALRPFEPRPRASDTASH